MTLLIPSQIVETVSATVVKIVLIVVQTVVQNVVTVVLIVVQIVVKNVLMPFQTPSKKPCTFVQNAAEDALDAFPDRAEDLLHACPQLCPVAVIRADEHVQQPRDDAEGCFKYRRYDSEGCFEYRC